MESFRDTRIGVGDAARLLKVSVSELKAAVQEETSLRGVTPPKPIYLTGSGGWVFKAGDVMDVAASMGGNAPKL